jgi:glycerophosphoryl diester phosphodiesterase
MSDTTTTRSVVSRSSSMSSDGTTCLSGRERIDKIVELYATGKPLFSREVLEDLVRQLERRPEAVYITTFVEDRRKMYRLKTKWCDTEYVDSPQSLLSPAGFHFAIHGFGHA